MKILLQLTFIMNLHFFFAASKVHYNALVFDRLKKSLIEVPDQISSENAKCGSWALACPATTDGNKSEEIFNQSHSLYRNALFVRNIYTTEDYQINLQKKICDKPFQLSVAQFTEFPTYYEFGYDIYFEHSDSEKFLLSNKAQYMSVIDTLSNTPSHQFNRVLQMPSAFNQFEHKDEQTIKLLIAQDDEKGFTWMPLFQVQSSIKHLIRAEYEIRRNNRRPMLECHDFSLGKEIFNSINVEELYSQQVQTNALHSLKLPERAEATCEPMFNCFKKWLLIPADQFQFNSSVPPVCSNMATIPIWSSIVEKMLKKLDIYLHALFQVSRKPLRIKAGITEQLRLPHKLSSDKDVLISLKYDNLTLLIPKIIYKAVMFKVTNYCNNDQPECWYGVLIVIHNDPNFDENHRICKDKSEELGWEEVTYGIPSVERVKSNYVYVCPITPDTAERVVLNVDEIFPINELSLKNFPHQLKDIRTKVFEKMEQIFSHADEVNFVSKQVLERPLMNNDDFNLELSEDDDEIYEDYK